MNPYEKRPDASWVMGRSARWHTAEGQQLLAVDPATEETRRDIAMLRVMGLGGGLGLMGSAGPNAAPVILDLLTWIACRSWRRRRRD